MSVLGRIARRALSLVPSDQTIPVIRGPLRGMRWITGSAPHGAWLGRLEREMLADFARHIRPESIVADVGANVGLYTLAAARRAAGGGRVVAFEPVPPNVALLRRHVEINHLRNVTIVEAAVGARAGRVRMAAGMSPSEYHVDPAGSLTVPAVTLDQWWAASELPPPHVVKIDVEGAEADVLRGAVALIGSARPRIYLAVHGETPARDCHRILDAAGYKLTSASGEPWPFDASEWIAVP